MVVRPTTLFLKRRGCGGQVGQSSYLVAGKEDETASSLLYLAARYVLPSGPMDRLGLSMILKPMVTGQCVAGQALQAHTSMDTSGTSIT